MVKPCVSYLRSRPQGAAGSQERLCVKVGSHLGMMQSLEMKSFPALFLAVTFLFGHTVGLLAQTDGQSVPQMIAAGTRAYHNGDYEAARRHFNAVRAVDPRNATAIRFLQMLRSQENRTQKKNDVESQLATVVIPKVEFREATLGSALEYLRQTVSKASGGERSVNFVLQVPEEQLRTQTITLSLTNVPFTEVLRYVGGLGNLQFSYDRYAVIVRPKPAAAAGGTEANP